MKSHLICVTLIFLCKFSFGQSKDDLARVGLATEIAKQVDSMLDWTKTIAAPGAIDGDKKKIGLMLVSSEAIFDIPTSKKAWLVFSSASTGSKLSSSADVKFAKILFTDSKLLKDKICYSCKPDLLIKLQKEVHSGKIDLDEFYKKLMSGLKKDTIK